MLSWSLRAAFVASLSLAACSSDTGSLIDSGTKPADKPEPLDAPDDVASMDAAPDAALDAPRDAAPDAAPDAPPDAPRDAAPDAAPDVTADASTDAPRDATPDIVADAAPDAPRDAAPDAAPDAPVDAGCGALTSCGGRCVDTATDARNCGLCGRDCAALPGADASMARCVAGACVIACAAGRGDCDRTVANGCEADLTTAANCGACGTACAGATPVCGAGAGGARACTSGCAAISPTLCGATCVNTQTDVNHCGACAMACAAPSNAVATCSAGRCGFACAPAFHLCAGACVSNASLMSCGASCTPCEARPNATASCDGAACRYACNAGFADCDMNPANGCERAVSADVANCGGCGVACPGADADCRRRSCTGGVCGFTDLPSGTRVATQSPRDCRAAVCNGTGGTTTLPDDSDLPVDGNPCTDDVCASGVPSNPVTPEGRGCGAGAMLCDGRGACVDCVRGSDCPSGVCTGGMCVGPSCSDGVRNGAETGVDCGGPACPVCPALLLLAGGATQVLAASYDTGARMWSPVTLAGRTVEGVALAVSSVGEGVGLMRYTLLGDAMDNRLRYTTWRDGRWSAFADLGPTVTTQGQPSLTPAPGGGVWAVFHGFDFNHYFAAYSTAWSTVAQATGASGARAGAIVRSGTNPLLVFSRGLPNELYSRERTGTAWGVDQFVSAPSGFDYNVPPSAVNLTATTVLAVWNAPGGQLRYATRVAGTWAPPSDVPLSLANGRVALARVTDTQAALAFRGTDGNLYAAFLTSGMWSTPARVATGITGVPSVARGIGGAVADLAFLDGAGRAMHSRYASGAWSTPSPVGGSGLASVAIASGP